MNEDRSEGGSHSRTWLDRVLSAVLSAEPKSRDELIDMLRDAEDRNLVDADVLYMIEGALAVADLQVRDIMVPRTQMVTVDSEAEPEAFIDSVINSGHSRFPVIGADRDDVEGILLAKDLLAHFAVQEAGRFNIKDAMRPAVFVPEAKRLNVLLREFRASRNHMAIVVDEYGGVAGLVTIEDVLEQIVGEIDDEHDVEEERYIKERKDGEFLVKALTPIEDFNEFFATDYSDEEFATIGGLVVKSLGHLPGRGEITRLGGFEFEILRADKRRVHVLRMRRV
ncbi:MAG: CBS domain-containing protein [Gammaproteobacteria bacterium]|nr:CBS domain-containing protein [Gammaproteobacteria bacterium]